jgi:hypothetical protein
MYSPVARLAAIVVFFAACGADGADDRVPATGPAGQTFSELFAKWEKLHEQAEALYNKYPDADDADKPGIEKQYNALLAQMKELGPTLADVTEAAYKESPNTNENVTKMFIGMAKGAYERGEPNRAFRLFNTLIDNRCDAAIQWVISLAQGKCNNDDYEKAAELIALLVNKGYQSPEIHEIAGIAAFCTNDFAAGQRYLKKAEAAGTISERGRLFLAECEEYAKFWERESTLRQQEAQADDLPRVKLATTKGDIVLELFENEAPQTVGNFVSLVEKGFYDGVTFHRVLANFMIQG